MKITILDDYFDTLRTLPCFDKLDGPFGLLCAFVCSIESARQRGGLIRRDPEQVLTACDFTLEFLGGESRRLLRRLDRFFELGDSLREARRMSALLFESVAALVELGLHPRFLFLAPGELRLEAANAGLELAPGLGDLGDFGVTLRQ